MRDKVIIQTERLVIRLADIREGVLISRYYIGNRGRLAPLELGRITF